MACAGCGPAPSTDARELDTRGGFILELEAAIGGEEPGGFVGSAEAPQETTVSASSAFVDPSEAEASEEGQERPQGAVTASLRVGTGEFLLLLGTAIILITAIVKGWIS